MKLQLQNAQTVTSSNDPEYMFLSSAKSKVKHGATSKQLCVFHFFTISQITNILPTHPVVYNLTVREAFQCFTYSCANIVSGSSNPDSLTNRWNVVRRRISAMSAFLWSSSPSLCPAIKCAQTKQKLVWCRDILIEMEPCLHNHRNHIRHELCAG